MIIHSFMYDYLNIEVIAWQEVKTKKSTQQF